MSKSILTCIADYQYLQFSVMAIMMKDQLSRIKYVFTSFCYAPFPFLETLDQIFIKHKCRSSLLAFMCAPRYSEGLVHSY